MDQSILDTTKKMLGISADYTAFDLDIITHINSVFSTLNQLGVGPLEGFMIEDNTTTWDAFFQDTTGFASVKSYIYLKVRQMFDPPATSFAIEANNKMIQEFEWRLNVTREFTPNVVDEVVLDGGPA